MPKLLEPPPPFPPTFVLMRPPLRAGEFCRDVLSCCTPVLLSCCAPELPPCCDAGEFCRFGEF